MSEYRDPDAGLRARRDVLLADVRADLRHVAWLAADRGALVARLVGSVVLLSGAALVLALGPGTRAAEIAILATFALALGLGAAGGARGRAHVLSLMARMTRTTEDVAADIERLSALRPLEWAETLANKRKGLSIALPFPAALVTVGVVVIHVGLQGADAATRYASAFYLGASMALLLVNAIQSAKRGLPSRGGPTSVTLRWLAGPFWGAGVATSLQVSFGGQGWFLAFSYALMAFGAFATLWVLPRIRFDGYRPRPPA